MQGLKNSAGRSQCCSFAAFDELSTCSSAKALTFATRRTTNHIRTSLRTGPKSGNCYLKTKTRLKRKRSASLYARRVPKGCTGKSQEHARAKSKASARGIHKSSLLLMQTVVAQSHHYTHQYNLTQVHYHCNQYNQIKPWLLFNHETNQQRRRSSDRHLLPFSDRCHRTRRIARSIYCCQDPGCARKRRLQASVHSQRRTSRFQQDQLHGTRPRGCAGRHLDDYH